MYIYNIYIYMYIKLMKKVRRMMNDSSKKTPGISSLFGYHHYHNYHNQK